MSDDNFAIWLRNQAPEGATQQEIARAVGINQGTVSKILRGVTKGDVRSSTYQRIAEHMGISVAQLHAEIHGKSEQGTRQDTDVVVPIDAKYRKEWDLLFRNNPRRAKRVLENLILQEREGYTDLVSKIVSHIVELGPVAASSKIGSEIDAWTQKSKKAATRKKSAKPRK